MVAGYAPAALEEIEAARERIAGTLLRPAAEPALPADTLLRPAAAGTISDDSVLLRPASPIDRGEV